MSQGNRAITPSEARKKTADDFPTEVIDAFNELIRKNFSNGAAVFSQEDVVNLLVEKGIERNRIFGGRLLDVEEVYRSENWIVEYSKPFLGDDFEPYFTFRSTAG
ncbi:MAG: hypothetical protein ABL899_02715 [Nitrospira sp.]